jgi:hypothetical protein
MGAILSSEALVDFRTKAHTKIPHRQMPTVINAHTKNTHTDNCSHGKNPTFFELRGFISQRLDSSEPPVTISNATRIQNDQSKCCFVRIFGQNYWVLGFCPPSGILKLGNTMFRKLGLFLFSGEERETPTVVGSLRNS